MAGTRSDVWFLATRLSRQEAQCNICSKLLKYCGTSTNIRRHLQKFHARALQAVEKTRNDEESDPSSDINDPGPALATGSKRTQRPSCAERPIKKYFSSSIQLSNENTETEAPQDKAEVVVVLAEDGESFEVHIDDQTTHINEDQLCATLLNQPVPGLSTSSSNLNEPPFSLPPCKPDGDRKRNSSIEECFKKIQSYQRGGEMDLKITGGLIYLIIKNCLPFSIVESDGFQYFMKVACPHYQIPSATSIKNAIDRKYDALFELEKKKLSSVKYFSLTVNVWTEKHPESSVLGVTAHYTDDQGQLKSVVLGSTEITVRHYADVIAEYIRQTLAKWSIQFDQISAITSDSGANIVAAVNFLVGPSRHIVCFADTLNLVLTAAFKDEKIDAVMKAVKNIVTWFRISCTDAYEREKVEDLCLLQACPTRWNSTLYMLRRFLEMKSAVSEILSCHSDAPQMIGADAIAVIEDLLPILNLFDSMTKECSKEKSVSVSRIIPIIDFMTTRLNAFESEVKTEIGTLFLKNIRKDFDKRFADLESNDNLSLCTLLDPRFKKIHFKDALKCSKAVLRLKGLMRTHSSMRDGNTALSGEPRQLTDLDNFTARKASSATALKPCEVTAYLQSSTIDVTVDPLQYWFINRHEYPQLYEISRRLLCIQGSSTPCECLFSIAGFIMNARWNRITTERLEERLEKLIFLKNIPRDQWEF